MSYFLFNLIQFLHVSLIFIFYVDVLCLEYCLVFVFN